jgi:hypothetical protein
MKGVAQGSVVVPGWRLAAEAAETIAHADGDAPQAAKEASNTPAHQARDPAHYQRSPNGHVLRPQARLNCHAAHCAACSFCSAHAAACHHVRVAHGTMNKSLPAHWPRRAGGQGPSRGREGCPRLCSDPTLRYCARLCSLARANTCLLLGQGCAKTKLEGFYVLQYSTQNTVHALRKGLERLYC